MHKIEKNNSIGISFFGYKNKERYSIYVSKKCCEAKHIDLLLIEEKGKRHHIFIKNFNTFKYNHTLHHGKNIFYHYLSQAFRTEEILKCHIKDCFKTNDNKKL